MCVYACVRAYLQSHEPQFFVNEVYAPQTGRTEPFDLPLHEQLEAGCTQTHTYIHMYVHSNTYRYVHTRTHIHTHTHTYLISGMDRLG
jgi:hypothetical protein